MTSIGAVIRRLSGWNELSWDKKRAIVAVLLSLFPISLPKLLRLFGSDKQFDHGHRYGGTYARLFKKYRYKAPNILEIGILGGSSLLAWRAYFPFGRIIGCDIVDKSNLSAPGIKIYKLDQSSQVDLENLVEREGEFHIIIDDGSDLCEHQIFSFNKLFDSVADGGTYIIEDIQTSYWNGKVGSATWDGAHIDNPAFANTCVGYFLRLATYLNYAEFTSMQNVDMEMMHRAQTIRTIEFEHNLIIIHKGANRDPSNLVGGGLKT